MSHAAQNTNLALAYTKLPSTTLWIASILNVCVILTVAPFMIYYLSKFNARKEEMFIQKRYPKLMIYANLPWTSAITILATTNSIRKLSPLLLSNPNGYIMTGYAWYAFLSIIIYYSQWLYLTRFWLIFFSLNYAKSNMNKKWKVHINPNLVDKDFWLKYRNNLGSEKYVLKLSIIGMIAFTLIAYSCVMINHVDIETTSNQVISVLYVFFGVIFFILFIKSPQIFDVFDIRQEMRLLILVILIGLPLNGIGIYLKYNSNKIISLSAMIWSMNIAFLSGTVMVFVSTYKVLKKWDSKWNRTKSLPLESRSQSAKELERVLLDPNNFELFVHHLLREFNVENVLCFIEMVQFKHLINDKFNLNYGKLTNVGRSYSIDENIETDFESVMEIKESDNKVNDSYEAELLFSFRTCDITRNTTIPKSSIVYNIDMENNKNKHGDMNYVTECLQIIYKLSEKYICTGELEINISGTLREQYINEMSDIELMINGNYNGDKKMEEIDLFEYFDAIIEEMYHLLAGTCERFLDSDPNVNIARIHLSDLDTTQIENVLSGHK
eukprot:215107_1